MDIWTKLDQSGFLSEIFHTGGRKSSPFPLVTKLWGCEVWTAIYPCHSEKPVKENQLNTGANPRDGEVLEAWFSHPLGQTHHCLPTVYVAQCICHLNGLRAMLAVVMISWFFSQQSWEAVGISPVLWKCKLTFSLFQLNLNLVCAFPPLPHLMNRT